MKKPIQTQNKELVSEGKEKNKEYYKDYSSTLTYSGVMSQ